MEIKTTVRDFSKNIKQYHLQPGTYIRVIVNDRTGESANAAEKTNYLQSHRKSKDVY